MKRRTFFQQAALGAIAISATGFIRFNGKTFEGDCETTTDILGPFYRPNSPVRNSLLRDRDPGQVVELSGLIRHNDCITPCKGAKVELWHCDAEGVYDNDTDDYRYRGTTYCDDDGAYSFQTVLPVPYDAGGQIRPAHFHMLISAPGYQTLVTQLYFTGDPHIAGDSSAADPAAKRRILEVGTDTKGHKTVAFDLVMAEQLIAAPKSLEQLAGTYRDTSDEEQTQEFFVHEGGLWQRNEVFGRSFTYIGDNTFEYGGVPTGASWTLHFQIEKGGTITLTEKIDYDGVVREQVSQKKG